MTPFDTCSTFLVGYSAWLPLIRVPSLWSRHHTLRWLKINPIWCLNKNALMSYIRILDKYVTMGYTIQRKHNKLIIIMLIITNTNVRTTFIIRDTKSPSRFIMRDTHIILYHLHITLQ